MIRKSSLFLLAWFVSSPSACAETIQQKMTCSPTPPKEGWSLGEGSSASLAELDKEGRRKICIYERRHLVDEVDVSFANDEFIASQTCYYKGRLQNAVFGVGSRGHAYSINLRLAWLFESSEARLIPVDPHQVNCIFNEFVD